MPRNKKNETAKRKSAVRKTRETAKAETRAKSNHTKQIKREAPLSARVAGANRAEGIRLFRLAGRPTPEQFVTVYGERGPKMTWDQRAAAGIPAAKFQAALAAKQRGN